MKGKIVLKKLFFALQVVGALFLATSAWPGIQMVWVLLLTGLEGLTPDQYHNGQTTPGYGWYLIATRVVSGHF